MNISTLTLIMIVLLLFNFSASASSATGCEAIVQILEPVACSSSAASSPNASSASNESDCVINFKAKCISNKVSKGLRKCKFKGDTFKVVVKMPAGDYSFQKGDNIKLSYISSYDEVGGFNSGWKYIGVENCGFWKSLFLVHTNLRSGGEPLFVNCGISNCMRKRCAKTART